MLRDDETGSYWHHVKGEAIFGSSVGKKMDVYSVQMMTVEEVLREKPDARIAFSELGTAGKLFGKIMNNPYKKQKTFPPGFEKSMGEMDPRLPEHTSGLGVIVDGKAKFYPFSELGEEQFDLWGKDDRKLSITWKGEQQAPLAAWDDGTVPLQLLTRWYGFSYSYPNCEIYNQP